MPQKSLRQKVTPSSLFAGGIDISKAKEVMRAEDKFDRQAEKERVRQRKLEEKRKRKEAEQRRRKVRPRGRKSKLTRFCEKH